MVKVSSLKRTVGDVLINVQGKRVADKIIIIESDDWGSIRTSSHEALDALENSGVKVRKSIYSRIDHLEREEDLSRLMDLLKNVQNERGDSPVITANTVVANPDFNKIKESDFAAYFYEPFTETLLHRDKNHAVFDLYQKGMAEGVFIPQFHGREHVNVKLWLQMLRNDKMFQLAFKFNMWGLSKDLRPDIPQSIQATYDTDDATAEESIRSGLQLFHKLFGFQSKTFIANNFVWNKSMERVLKEEGVMLLQGMKYQLLPIGENQKERRKVRRHFGQKNGFGQYFSVRNCSFEPAERGDTVSSCLKQIGLAFTFKKPAVISSHRLNFMGGLSEQNAKDGREMLHDLLIGCVKKWPDVKFLSSDQLIDYMNVTDNNSS